ncbi:MAG TPA: hypothetical protein VI753_11985 [Anaerolineales bacterium]|nr:hypothetical protein [Anaerolineales bacterium]
MVDIGSRAERIVDEMAGNEALLEMLETEAATEMLNWGIEMATSLVKSTEELDQAAAEQELLPRLKAVRQVMRSVGNWAAGKYVDPASRVQLRDKLLENFKVIFGEEARLPSPEKMDELLNQVDDRHNTPHQLILKLKHLLEEAG